MASDLTLNNSNIARAGGLFRAINQLRLPWIPVLIMLTLVICAAFAPLLAPKDPEGISMMDRRIPPFVSFNSPLGTDIMGRDVLSRLIFGARTTVFISLVALGTGALVGTILGLVAGYNGKWPDILIMRLADAALGFPTVLVAMIIVTLPLVFSR